MSTMLIQTDPWSTREHQLHADDSIYAIFQRIKPNNLRTLLLYCQQRKLLQNLKLI